MEDLIQRLERAVVSVEEAAGVSRAGSDGGLPPAVQAYDVILSGDVKPLVETCSKLRGPQAELGVLFDKGFNEVRKFIIACKQCQKPTDEEMKTAVGPLIQIIQDAGAKVDNKSDAFQHQSACYELLQGLQWVMVPSVPKSIVDGAKDSAAFYLNKVLTTNKDAANKEDHRAFVKLSNQTLSNLSAYIKQFHTTGLAWTPSGVAFSSFDLNAAPSSSPAPAKAVSAEAKLAALVDRLEAMAAHSAGDDGDGEHPSIAAWKEIHETKVMKAVAGLRSVGAPELDAIAALYEKASLETLFFVRAAKECKKPSDEVFGAKAQPLIGIVGEAGNLPNKDSAYFNHQKSFAEIAQMFQWVLISPTPAPFVQAAFESANFYLIKVLTQFKDDAKKADHRAFVNMTKELNEDIKSFIKKHHSTGLAWNPKGGDIASFK